MFDKAAGGMDLLNTGCSIYEAISDIATVMRTSGNRLRFGRIYLRQISGDGEHFGISVRHGIHAAVFRPLYPEEILVAYNVSDEARADCVVVDAAYHANAGAQMQFLYGGAGSLPVQTAADGTRFVQLNLAPHQFVILQ